MTDAGLNPRRMPLSSTLFFALVLATGLALAPQTAQAATGEIDAGASLPGSEEALLPQAQTRTADPIVVADKNWNKNWNGNKNWNKNWNGNKNSNKNWNNNWSKNHRYNNNNYKHGNNYKYSNKKYVYKKKVYVQRWTPRPYYGEFFGGIVLGSILTAAAVGVAPPPPAPELCWYWMDPYQSRGYWDYCPY